MHPYEQDLDNDVNLKDDEESEEDEAVIEQTVSKIKVAKLKNDYKNFCWQFSRATKKSGERRE